MRHTANAHTAQPQETGQADSEGFGRVVSRAFDIGGSGPSLFVSTATLRLLVQAAVRAPRLSVGESAALDHVEQRLAAVDDAKAQAW